MFRSIFKLVAFFAVMAASPAVAQVSADFTTGAIAEYSSNNANRNDNTASFAALGISKITMSQSGTSWGGTQGNDLSVTLTITFIDNSTYTTPSAVLNWQKNASGGGVDYFGVTTSTVAPDASDRYTRSSNLLAKTYILALPGNLATSDFSGLIASDGTDGSANFSPADVFAALQADFPAPAVVSISNTTNAGEPSTNGVLTVSLSNTSTSPTVITYSVAGTATSGTDYTALSGTVTVAANQTSATISVPVIDDSTVEGAETVIVTLTSVTSGTASLSGTPTALTATNTITDNDTAVNNAPTFTSMNAGGGTSYTFDYAENSTSAAVVGTVSAADPENTTLTFSITAGNADGWFAIDGSTGAITLTTAGAASLANDFETTPNLQTLTVSASDGVNVTTVQVALNETDANDGSPAFTSKNAGGGTSYTFDYAENSASAAVVGTVSASDPENTTLTLSITAGNADGWFAIDGSTGAITLTTAGAASLANDFETTPNLQTLTVSASDGVNITTVQVALNETNADDTLPAITGPTGSAGAANDAISVNEGQTAVARLIATETVTWSIASGNDEGKFRIAADGTITFVAAPDFESPTDTDTNNTYVLTITATDTAGNVSTQTITVTVLNIDDAAPVITGPSGGAGAAASAISVNEAQTAVTRVVANETVIWSITSGNDRGKFQIATDGTIVFVTAPDFEIPTDTDTNNTYVLTVTATDTAGNVSTQTITVTVLNIDDTAPVITGPNGGPGAAASALTIAEGLTAITRFTANETVTWSIDSGLDAGKFRIDAATGAIVFVAAPDFENPTDSDQNNTYVVRIKATDAAGNVSFQTFTVTITNIDEIARKLSQIGDKLRGSLRSYAAHGLSDMLAFNESLMASNDNACADPKTQKGLSGSARANETGSNLNVQYSQRLSECSRPHQLFADAGLSSSRMGGNWNSRIFGALRLETKFNDDVTLGLAALASRSSDELTGFENSSISDKSLQVNAYGRYTISDTLRTGAFIGYGSTWYDFALTENDGFDLDGSMTGKRKVYGWMLSGDFNLGEMTVTTDAIISHAREKIGSATLAARYLGENRSNIAFAVGTVDVTRISVPVTAPINLIGSPELGAWSRLLFSPGLLCEDNDVQRSGLRCGYQLGAKLVADDGGRGRFYADYNWESVAGMRRALIGIGYAYRIGKKNNMELAIETNRGVTAITGQDNRAMLSIRLAQ